MAFALELQLAVALRCRVCRKLLGDSLPTVTVMVGNTETKVPLGIVIGGECPCCKQQLEPNALQDRNCRRRLRRWLKNHAASK